MLFGRAHRLAPQQPEMPEDAPVPPHQGPVMELLSMNLSNPFLSQCCICCQALGGKISAPHSLPWAEILYSVRMEYFQ